MDDPARSHNPELKPIAARHGISHHPAQLLCAAGILLIVVFVEIPGTAQYSQVIQNSGHAPAFGLLSLLLLSLLPPHPQRPWRRLAYAFALTVALGIATELAQAVLHRDAEITDVLHDAIGALAALGFYLYYRARRDHARSALPRLGLVTGILCSAIAFAPLTICAAAYWHRSAQFPVIAQFNSPLDRYFVASTDPQAAVIDNALAMRLNSGNWPGVELSEPAPDWSGYRELLVDISNPGSTALPLGIRVNDRQHNFAYDDRFSGNANIAANSRMTLRYSLQEIAAAPRGRRMDMHNIATVIIFRSGAVAGQSLLLHRVWLQ